MCKPCNGITENGLKCRNKHFTTNKNTSDGKYYCKHHHPNKEEAFGNYVPKSHNYNVEYVKIDYAADFLKKSIQTLCFRIFALYLVDDFDEMHNIILPSIFDSLYTNKTKLAEYDADTVLITNQIFEIFEGNRALKHNSDYDNSNYRNGNNYIDMLNLLLRINIIDNIEDVHIIIKQHEKFLFGVIESNCYTHTNISMISIPNTKRESKLKLFNMFGIFYKSKENKEMYDCLRNEPIISFDELTNINDSLLNFWDNY